MLVRDRLKLWMPVRRRGFRHHVTSRLIGRGIAHHLQHILQGLQITRNLACLLFRKPLFDGFPVRRSFRATAGFWVALEKRSSPYHDRTISSSSLNALPQALELVSRYFGRFALEDVELMAQNKD